MAIRRTHLGINGKLVQALCLSVFCMLLINSISLDMSVHLYAWLECTNASAQGWCHRQPHVNAWDSRVVHHPRVVSAVPQCWHCSCLPSATGSAEDTNIPYMLKSPLLVLQMLVNYLAQSQLPLFPIPLINGLVFFSCSLLLSLVQSLKTKPHSVWKPSSLLITFLVTRISSDSLWNSFFPFTYISSVPPTPT